jgi:tetratricopeptide (TPR) repeat protein
MPSPIGHALGGIAAGWLIQPPEETSRRGGRTATLAFAILGVAADLDLIVGTHRGPTHSLGAAVMIGLMAWAILRRRTDRAGRLAGACAAAYGSHILLDWLGSDTSPPIGLPALWPFSLAYYEAPWHVFLAVSRRVHQPELFWLPNARALARELLILLPVVTLVGYVRPKRPRFRRAIVATIVILGAGAAIVQGSGRQVPMGSTQQSNAYVQAVVRYLGGGFDNAIDAVAAMSEEQIRDQAGELAEDPRTMKAAVMLHTEVAFRPGVDVDGQMATYHLARARQLVHDLRKTQSREFQRGWYLFLSAQLQGGQALDAADKCLAEALGQFPRDPDVLVATGAAFELRTFSSSPLPQVQRLSGSGQIRTSEPDRDVRHALESSARYLSAAAEVAPEHDEARLRLGRVHHRLGQVDRAADELDVVRRRASDANIKYLATLFEAAVENSRGRPSRATELYLDALGIVRAQAAFIGLSDAYYDQGRGAEAAGALQAVFRQSLEPDPWFAYLIGDAWHTDSRRAAMRALVTRR